jgi:carbonic anhydrase
MADIRKRSAVLADLGVSGAIKIVGAMYNLETGRWSSSNYVPVCGRSASQTEG